MKNIYIIPHDKRLKQDYFYIHTTYSPPDQDGGHTNIIKGIRRRVDD